MIRTLLKKLRPVLLTGLVLACLLPAAPAQAGLFDNAVNQACQGTQLSEDETVTCDDKAGGRVSQVLRLVLNVFSFVVGVIAVIMIIIAGLKYITSAGDSAGVNSAKNTILYAVIGLVIVALAQFIVRFVLKKASQADGVPVSLGDFIG